MAQQAQQRGPALENYVTVAERIADFYQAHPQGRVTTHILEHNEETGFILMRAEVFRSTDDAQASATGHAFEVRGEGYVNKTSYVENAETSAVGRALALLGFETKRQPAQQQKPGPRAVEQKPAAVETANLVEQIRDQLARVGKSDSDLVLWARKKFGDAKITVWQRLADEQKRQALEMLRTQPDKAAEQGGN